MVEANFNKPLLVAYTYSLATAGSLLHSLQLHTNKAPRYVILDPLANISEDTGMYTYTHMYVLIHTHTYVHTHIRMYVHTHMCIYTHAHKVFTKQVVWFTNMLLLLLCSCCSDRFYKSAAAFKIWTH